MGNKSDIIIIFPHLSLSCVMGIRVSNGSEFRCDRQDAALGNSITRDEYMEDLYSSLSSALINFHSSLLQKLSFHDHNFYRVVLFIRWL